MRRFWEFLSGSGGWGLTSALTAFVLYVIALWEHARDKPITAFILLAATLPVFCAGAYMSWLKKAVQLERIQQQLREIPRIRDVKGSFKSDVRGWGILDPTTGEHQKHEDIRSLVVSFRNDPEFRCDAANAKEQVIARMEFFNIDVEQSPQRLFTRAFSKAAKFTRDGRLILSRSLVSPPKDIFSPLTSESMRRWNLTSPSNIFTTLKHSRSAMIAGRIP